jgi:N-acetylglucosamine-6-phosphate deacetylase
MKTILRNGAIVTEDRVTPGDILLDRGKIVKIGELNEDASDTRTVDCRGKYILPGFFETHMHGINYYSCTQGKIDPRTFDPAGDYDDAVHYIMRYLPGIGVTSSFLSGSAVPMEMLKHFLVEARSFMEAPAPKAARLLGIDLEGSFLKDPKYGGAQEIENYLNPSVEIFEELQELSGGAIKKVLIAPEWGEEAFKLMRYLSDRGLFPTVGHTGCTRQELLKAHEAGTLVVVHCGNGPMSQNFKSGGALDGIFELGSSLYGEVICDFCHVHPHWINTFIKCFSLEHVIGISDSNHLTGSNLEDGTRVKDRVVRDGALWIADRENTLAGSMTSLDRGFNNILNLFTGDRKTYFQREQEVPYSLDEALPLACRLFSLNPAELFGLDKEIGSIAPEKEADLIVAEIEGEPGNYCFSIDRVFISGEPAE